MSINYRNAKFYASYTDIQQSDILQCPQIAFVGRSNAGKSSLLNALCDNKKLARTSNSPGRTQAIVTFALQEPYFLIDLPGYGYAKISKKMRQSWRFLLESYVRHTTQFDNQGLLGLVIAVDSRRLLQEMDVQMVEFANFYGIGICVFLTKMDKLKQQQRQVALNEVSKELQDYADVQVMIGSSTPKKQNIEQLAVWMTENLQKSQSSI